MLYVLFIFRLSLQLEPEPAALRKKPRVPNSISSSSQQPSPPVLRTSKSYEDLLTPFTTNGIVNPSSITTGAPSSSSSRQMPEAHHKVLKSRHSAGVLDQPLPDDIIFDGSRSNSVFSETQISFQIDESSPASVKKNATLPSVLRGASLSGLLPQHFEHPERKSKSLSEQAALLNPPPDVKIAAPNLAKKMLGSPGARGKRGHKKSHSLGTK